MFAYTKFLFDNIRLSRVTIVSPDTDVKVMSLYESLDNLTFLDAIWFKAGAEDEQRYITYTSISFRIKPTNMLLASCSACNIRM